MFRKDISYSSTIMYAYVILMVLLGCGAGYSQSSQPRTCQKVALGCSMFNAVSKAAQCQTDAECQDGAQCCYTGCVKNCELPNPCESVICKDGYLCHARETPCKTPPCRLEATCLPEIQVRCIVPVCNTLECQPGFERANDSSGCPTCECVRKPDCGPNCFIFCAHGFEKGKDGCPICTCKPEPQNPCSNMSCGQNEECRFVDVVCKRAPCIPTTMCVRTMKVQYENACSLTDPTTVGLPILDRNGVSEIDGYLQTCPANTVHTNMGKKIKRCCWQSTQDQVLAPPKAGECPYSADFLELTQKCQVDGTCPGEQKCCFRQTDQESLLTSGFCVDPTKNSIKSNRVECQAPTFIRFILRRLGMC